MYAGGSVANFGIFYVMNDCVFAPRYRVKDGGRE